MEIQEIRYFLALSETLNFTRAAERCNVTQPALTRAIRSLEDKLGGKPLIHRERGNTHLTELGRMMKPYFEQMLAGLEQAKAKAKGYSKLTDTKLTLGLMCTIGPTRLVEFFAGFSERHAGIELYLKDARAGVLEETLRKGELDVALYGSPEGMPDELHALPLFEERMMVAVAPDHPFARRTTLRLRDHQGERYLSRANCEFGEYLYRTTRENGVEPRICYRSERDDWIQSMVLAGLGCTTIPEFACTVPGLVLRPLSEPAVTRTINLVTVRGRPHTPAVGAFVHEAKRYRWLDRLRVRLPESADGDAIRPMLN
ncbi:MAG: LysR family transcriptional regulator [Hyphomicrobiaceae bacterium]